MHTHRHTTRATNRLAAGATAAALGLGTMWVAAPAQAAEATVDDVTLTWQLNDETGGGAYFGGCNFLSAGAAGNAGSSRLWTEADGFYAASAGNVSIVKPAAGGGTTAPTWATKCQNASGATVSPAAGSTTGNAVVLEHGTGTVDPAAGTANVAWEGAFTIVFYGGLTYWSVSDPELSVAADGTARLVGTASGYGASMEDPSRWEPLPSAEIVLADLSGVTVDADGFTATPAYQGVDNGQAGQVKTGASWGSFPVSFVDFQTGTGQSSYWYSSGGAADPKKIAKDVSVAWALDATDPGGPEEPGEPEQPAEGEVPIDVTVPEAPEEPEEPGEFTWTIQGGAPSVSLGTATVRDGSFVASGVLPRVTITDTRAGQPAWAVNGSVSDFASGTKTFSGRYLGWGPALGGDNTVGAGNGRVVVAGEGEGLKASSTLASAPAGHPKGSVYAEAAIDLRLPLETEAGDYTGVLTLTAIG